jgi:hypothetical protein
MMLKLMILRMHFEVDFDSIIKIVESNYYGIAMLFTDNNIW